jgi:hypothetical protein
MSHLAKGATRVRVVETHLRRHGFRTVIVSRSGQRRGARANSLAFNGDVVVLSPANARYPHFVIEIGGKSMLVRALIAQMTVQTVPAGFVSVVVRLVNAKTRSPSAGWHVASDDAHGMLDELLESRVSA